MEIAVCIGGVCSNLSPVVEVRCPRRGQPSCPLVLQTCSKCTWFPFNPLPAYEHASPSNGSRGLNLRYPGARRSEDPCRQPKASEYGRVMQLLTPQVLESGVSFSSRRSH